MKKTPFIVPTLLFCSLLIWIYFGNVFVRVAKADVPYSEIQDGASLPYKSIDSVISEYQAKGYQAERRSRVWTTFGGCGENNGGEEECGDSVDLVKYCGSGENKTVVHSLGFSVGCKGFNKEIPYVNGTKINTPCIYVTEKALNYSKLTTDGIDVTFIENQCKNSNSLPPPNTCTLPADEESKRQEIFNYLNSKYKFKVADTNVCGQLSDCGNNPPWPSEDLNKVKNLLDSLPACFVNNLNLNQISGVQWSPQIENKWDPNSLGQRISKNICCSQEAKDNCNVAHYWGQGYNNITVCGDMNNWVNDQGNQCKKYFTLEGVLAHEMTHALQFSAPGVVIEPQIYSTVLMISWMNKTGWTTNWKTGTFCLPILGCQFVPPGDLPSNYAKSSNDPAEDMAESVRLYYENPDLLKQISQRRYDFVKDKVMCGTEFTK